MAKLKEKLRMIDPKLGLVQIKGTRQKTELELDDIDEAINKLAEARCLPLVLASSNMVLRAPRFWGKDKGEDIAGVAAELKELKEAMVRFVTQNQRQISELKQEVVNATTVLTKPRGTARHQVLSQSQTPVAAPPLTPGGTAKRTRFDFESEVEEVKENNEDSWTDVTYAKKVGKMKETATETLVNMLSESKKEKVTKTKTKVIYGSGKSEREEVSLAADVTLVAFNVNKNCDKDSMKTFLIEKGLDVVDVSEMTREEVLPNVAVKSMKVVVKATEYEKAMDPNNWPCRVGVRLWKDKEAQKARYLRWQENKEQSRSKPGDGQERGRGRSQAKGGASSQQWNRKEQVEAGGKRKHGVKEQNRSRSGNRYQGNIFEELLRQVLRA